MKIRLKFKLDNPKTANFISVGMFRCFQSLFFRNELNWYFSKFKVMDDYQRAIKQLDINGILPLHAPIKPHYHPHELVK